MNNQLTEPQQETKSIYYWLDGYWITDKEEAELMDEINAFGSTHGVLNVLASADNKLIDTAVQDQLKRPNASETETPVPVQVQKPSN